MAKFILGGNYKLLKIALNTCLYCLTNESFTVKRTIEDFCEPMTLRTFTL